MKGRGATEFLRGPMGAVVARPWFDQLTMAALKRLFCPLSRLWAAAEEADGRVDHFCDALGLELSAGEHRLIDAMVNLAALRDEAEEIDGEWDAVFFGAKETSASARVDLEHRRRRARDAHNRARRLFGFLVLKDIPLARLEVPSPDDVAGKYGRWADDAEGLFRPAVPVAPIEQSQAYEDGAIRHFWLRFPSPCERLADTVYAHVYEPVGNPDPPTVILGHGICVEFDHWQGLLDEAAVLCQMGLRVVRPEAPFHGRRRRRGYYVGEQVIAQSPLGALDCFVGAVAERAVLMDWCRRHGSAPVAIGGSSLGAMMAIATVERSHDWPQALRPDGLVMITLCERPFDALVHGSLARMFGSQQKRLDAGWSDDLLQHYLKILEPTRGPVMPAEKIVAVLGRHDTATPFASGLALLDRWQVPAENRTLWRCGHFTVPMRLARDSRPLRRFADVMGAAN